MDSFLLSYRFVDGESDQSNSHKILEYLSTGKVLISSFVETYRNMQPTIYMTDENRDDDLVSLYKQVTTQLDYVNSAAHQEERIKLALANHYSAHINKIENLVNNL